MDIKNKNSVVGSPLLSIGIPHLNDHASLNACLGALSQQVDASPSFEVIVVDNGSETPPIEIVDRFSFARFEIETEPGPGYARNRAVQFAQSDLIAFIDSDCTAGPDWVKQIVNFFDNNPDTDVIGGEVLISPIDPKNLTAIEAYESIFGYRMQLYIERHHYTASCNMAVRKAVFDKVGGFGGIDIAEDRDWGLRATNDGAKIDYLPEMLIQTKARSNIQELQRKWDRHIGHDYSNVVTTIQKGKWVFRALAVFFSPIAEIPRILTSKKVKTLRDKILAALVVTQIRTYRFKRMIELSTKGNSKLIYKSWRNQ